MSNPQRIAYQQSVDTAVWSERCLLAAFALLGVPNSFNDIGCGDGHLVDFTTQLDIPSFGIDINTEQRELHFGEVACGDLLTWNLRFIPRYEMTFCLEVGEHLPKEKAGRLCHVLASCTAKTLVFSAAVPGQGGSGHINEQWEPYWQQKLERRGFVKLEETTKNLKKIWSIVAAPAWWYGQNVQVFKAQ